jgi:hypothetical protein
MALTTETIIETNHMKIQRTGTVAVMLSGLHHQERRRETLDIFGILM